MMYGLDPGCGSWGLIVGNGGIGNGGIISADAAVTKYVEPYAIYAGVVSDDQ